MCGALEAELLEEKVDTILTLLALALTLVQVP